MFTMINSLNGIQLRQIEMASPMIKIISNLQLVETHIFTLFLN